MNVRRLVVLFTFLAILSVSNLSMVQARPNAVVMLPVGETAYKITLAADGLYEITADDLAAAGMEIATVDPSTIEMMQHGKTVSYQFIGDDDAFFELGERIRFYGWQFDGTKEEKWYVGDENVFWLWANGSGSAVPTVDNPAGYTQVTTAPAELTFEEEKYVVFPGPYHTDTYQNEPDYWYWERYDYHFNDVTVEYGGEEIFYPSKNYELEIPYPADTAETARFTAEFQTPYRGVYTITTTLAGGRASESWHFWKNEPAFHSDPFPTMPLFLNNNINGTVPNNALSNGSNLFNISGEASELSGDQYEWINNGKVHLNRITVNYIRDLVTDDDQLIFNGTEAGAHEYLVSGFSGASTSPIVWKLDDKHDPQAIALTESDVQDNGSGETWRIAADHTNSAQFIATTEANIMRPDTVEAYAVPSIEPEGGAEWVAISHGDFLPAINQLAEYRRQPNVMDTDGFMTHVVDLQDVINQYGYGFFTPEGVEAYLHHALMDWTTAPDYVVLGGDGSWNPLQRECIVSDCVDWWDADVQENYFPVKFEFSNLEVGFFITDHNYATLLGDDLIAEFAVGRFPAQTLDEMQVMVDKTILYDQRMLYGENSNRFILPSDDADAAGDFCAGNNELAQFFIPDYYETIEVCLDHHIDNLDIDDFTSEGSLKRQAYTDWRETLFAELETGVDLLNYRGHGAVDYWQSRSVFHAETHAPLVNNVGNPAVFISHDCLDSDFSRNGRASLGETFLKMPNKGAAAHLGATSLGYNWQHMVTQRGFYDALFDGENGKTRIGDAMLSGADAYLSYERRDEFRPFVAETVLLGDPALLLVPADPIPSSVTVGSQDGSTVATGLFLPIALLVVVTIAVAPKTWQRVD